MIPVLVSKMQNRGLWLLLLLLSVGRQVFAADPPAGVAAENLASNQGVKELIDVYKGRESKIHSLEVQWEEDVDEGTPNGTSRLCLRTDLPVVSDLVQAQVGHGNRLTRRTPGWRDIN